MQLELHDRTTVTTFLEKTVDHHIIELDIKAESAVKALSKSPGFRSEGIRLQPPASPPWLRFGLDGLPLWLRHDCVMVQCVQSTAEAGKSVECFTEDRPTRKQTR